MNEEVREVIGVEHLKTVLSTLTPEDIVKHAYKEWSPQEYEEYLEFKDDEVCEYTPDIVSDFCQKKGIDENERKIGLLAYKFEKNEQSNYNQWESKILNKYYDVIMDDYNPFKQMDNDF